MCMCEDNVFDSSKKYVLILPFLIPMTRLYHSNYRVMKPTNGLLKLCYIYVNEKEEPRLVNDVR